MPRRRVWLRFHDQPDFELPAGVTIVGRGEGCQLVLDDPLISRRHACFVVDDREVTLKDLGSTNGVLVNGARVDELQMVEPGDQITLGHHQAELCWVPFSAADGAPGAARNDEWSTCGRYHGGSTPARYQAPRRSDVARTRGTA